MRQRLVTLALGLVLLSGLTPACGGSSGGDGGGGGDPPSFTVTDLSPGVLPSEVASDFSVLGTGFAPVGGTATVRLTAETGTPFEGGTSATIEFPSDIDSDTELTGSSSAFATVAGATRPAANALGHAAREILDALDGTSTIDEIAERVVTHHPDTFLSPEHAGRFVRRMVRNFS